MQDLNDLYYFAKVVEAGGFAAAGRLLGIPKSRLSRRIAELEERLGARLLQRTTRQLTLTAVGERYLRHCQAMLLEAEMADEAVASMSSEPRGRLRVSCPVGMAQHILPELVAGFLAAHPQVQLEMTLVNRRVDLVAEGIDVAIRVRPPPLPDSDMVLRVLAERSQCMVGSPLLFAGAPLPKAPADLADWPSLALGAPQQHYQWDLHGPDGARAQLRHTPRFVTGDMLTLRDAAVAGVGVVQLPTMMIVEQVANGSLLPLMAQWRPQREIIHAVFPSRRGLLPAVRALIDYLAHSFAALEEE